MFILPIDRGHPDREILKQAVDLMRRGCIVAYATDTAYGFGTDATRRDAVKKIYALKGRSWNKRMPIIVSSVSMARQYVRFSKKARQLAQEYWPGPLTLILPVTKTGSQALHVRQTDTIAVRVTQSPLARALARTLGHPITSTSANKSGQPDCYDIHAIQEQFADRRFLPACLLDSGVLPRVQPSTIVEVKGEIVQVIRDGPVRVL